MNGLFLDANGQHVIAPVKQSGTRWDEESFPPDCKMIAIGPDEQLTAIQANREDRRTPAERKAEEKIRAEMKLSDNAAPASKKGGK